MSEFEYITKDIINKDKFQSLKDEPHHGINRYRHVMHVAKLTYHVGKGLHLDYVEATRGALLHDYFNNEEYGEIKGPKKNSVHPEIALNNAKKDHILTKKEENIIVSHMFPYGDIKPNCKESWLVTTVDKLVAVYECSFFKWKDQLSLFLIFIVNLARL